MVNPKIPLPQPKGSSKSITTILGSSDWKINSDWPFGFTTEK